MNDNIDVVITSARMQRVNNVYYTIMYITPTHINRCVDNPFKYNK